MAKVVVEQALHCSVPPAQIACDGQAARLRVLMLSDLHLPHNPEAARRIWQSRAFLESCDHVVLLGDQCGSFATEAEYRCVDSFIRHLQRPYSVINGNHEFYFATPPTDTGRAGSQWRELDTEGKRIKLERFRRFYGVDKLWHARHTARGSFIFLGLDDIDRSKPESLSPAQWRFLEESLRVAPGTPAFVFCHAPVVIDRPLDMIYYDATRSGCVEPGSSAAAALCERAAPVFWISGHVHLRPDHYLYIPYRAAANVWQVHSPDSWGYSRWLREQAVPERHGELYSRYCDLSAESVSFGTYDYINRCELAPHAIPFSTAAHPG